MSGCARDLGLGYVDLTHVYLYCYSHSEEQYLSGDVGRFLPNLVNFSVSLFLVFYSVQLSVILGVVVI